MKLLKGFLKSFISAQLVSAESLSALFSLCEFSSVDNIEVKCFAWPVCLMFLFDKKRYYENVWNCFFIFFETLWMFLEKFKVSHFFLRIL